MDQRDLGQCVKQVSDHTGFHWFRCSRKAKGLVNGRGYCAQHGKMVLGRLERAERMKDKTKADV